MSIKVVLPAIFPAMSYKDLLIADGKAAAKGFRKMLDPNTSKDAAASIRSALLAYCCQDTLAMVEIYRTLSALALCVSPTKKVLCIAKIDSPQASLIGLGFPVRS